MRRKRRRRPRIRWERVPYGWHNERRALRLETTSPYPGSVRSGTPYSQMSNASTQILAVTSWSENAEEDLVSNLGFMSPTGLRSDGASGLTPETKSLAPTTPNIDDESAESEMEDDHLPGLQSNRANMSEKHSHPRSPYRAGSVLAGKSGKVKESVPFPSRSHASLPPVQRMNQVNASSQSLGRQSGLERDRVRDRDKDRDRKDSAKTTPTVHSRLLRRPKRSQTQPDASLHAIPPHLLPEDLRICLEVIERIP